jgi:hypothetical protein
VRALILPQFRSSGNNLSAYTAALECAAVYRGKFGESGGRGLSVLVGLHRGLRVKILIAPKLNALRVLNPFRGRFFALCVHCFDVAPYKYQVPIFFCEVLLQSFSVFNLKQQQPVNPHFIFANQILLKALNSPEIRNKNII